jgi:hypothetical protein
MKDHYPRLKGLPGERKKLRPEMVAQNPIAKKFHIFEFAYNAWNTASRRADLEARGP